MKKVAITTLIGPNLGNRLQNYALQQVLVNLGVEVNTLDYRNKNTINEFIKKCIKIALGIIGVKKYKHFFWQYERTKRFESFSRRYIKLGPKVQIDSISKNLNSRYDFFITGSDQVWHNWKFAKKELQYFYLMFADKKKRISYAPSFGFTKIPDSDLHIHKEGLNDMASLSCRELDGCRLIYETIGKKAYRVIDPTFLLSKSEWMKIEKKPNWLTMDKYIVTYFLGNKVEEYNTYINELSRKDGLNIVNIFSMESKNEYMVTPDEFIYLIHNAEFICTDSFHACAFSIIFNKKFIAFPRKEEGMEDMKGRIETLFKIMQIKERWYYSDSIEEELGDSVEDILINEKHNAFNFLRKALDIKKENM